MRQIADQLATIPGVEATSAVFGALPYTGHNNAVDFWRAGEPEPDGSDALLTFCNSAVGPEHFRAMGIPLVKGPTFVPSTTRPAARAVAIVDDAFARSVFQARDPIGQRIDLDSDESPVEVVGVVGHVKHWGLDPLGAPGPVSRSTCRASNCPRTRADGGQSQLVVRSSRPAAEIWVATRGATRLRQRSGDEQRRNDGGGISRSLATVGFR